MVNKISLICDILLILFIPLFHIFSKIKQKKKEYKYKIYYAVV